MNGRMVCGGRVVVARAAGAAAHGAAGAAEHAAPRARAAPAVPLPGAGRLGHARRAGRGHLPLHAQAAAGLRARPAPQHGLHLGQDHRRRPGQSRRLRRRLIYRSSLISLSTVAYCTTLDRRFGIGFRSQVFLTVLLCSIFFNVPSQC